MQRQHNFQGGTSRRGFLKGAMVLGSLGPKIAWAQKNQAKSVKGSILAYVGTYSSPQGPEGSKGNGQGICLFQMDPSTGALSLHKLFKNGSNPSWLTFDSSRTHLYSANETQDYQGTKSGSVSAYSIDRASGDLTLLNTVSSEGAGPCHLSIHPSGKFALVANYYGGTIAVLPIRSKGELGPATDVKEDKGTVGPIHSSSAPPGSFAISGHERTHAHMIESDPAGKFVLSSDLGMDRIFIWKFDVEKGKLHPGDPASVSLPPGDGPRHFTFHQNGRWFYSLQEEGSTVVLFDYDAPGGKLTARQTISTLPKGFGGTNFTSEIVVSPDGKFLYAANRLHDSIAFFSIASNGTLTLVGEEWTRGDYPRSFNFDPTGNFLYSCNQRGDAIAAFRVNRQSGALTFTGQITPVGTPAIIIFLT
jgi:6-phosphogluconolactonase